MKFSFLSLHPEFIDAYLSIGIFKRAVANHSIACESLQIRDFAVDKHGTIDGRPYGGGDSMVLRPEPLADALNSIKGLKSRVLLPSPRGKVWTQNRAKSLLADFDHLIFICPRFAGVDQRLIDLYVDEEFSMGEFIVSGGELPALMAADSITRFVPGALGNQVSHEHESFSDSLVGYFEEDLYTKPEIFEDIPVPEVLRTGNHKKIEIWKKSNRKLYKAEL